ncbi:uncharacterized protein LTR77_006414 [Saxophila tyrrhenica]|uniref:DUF803-domain-containing protein n=1 Tax=Saxophila tyrrhenica TaxID=1690608 RepID=A0AAV9PC26_9PEZI|nr:hypothetical protein LTR77_006414 [Saxophila tyrrhenica]
MDEAAAHILYASTALLARADNDNNNGSSSGNSTSSDSTSDSGKRPATYKIVGICLAIASGLFIGVSFVIKKMGLLKANAKYHEEAGEGYGYLKNAWWWTGMTLMILGEICNFVAYAFTDAILVTPLGALSVVVTTVLSAIFLKERLSFVGKVSCFQCILGSVIIVLNAPEQAAVADIQEMQHFVISPGFLSYSGVIILGSAAVAWFVAPKYGKKSMLVYLSICSLIGGLSVVATQGLGSAVLAQINGKPQFNQWFLYVLLVFVIATLLTEIIYLNKALNIFNAALVTPTYYVYFTSSTIVASAVLFQGFHGTGIQIADVVMGFLVICSGVVLLQLAKSSKDVPDTAVFKGDLDQVRTVAEQEEPEYEPRADTIRGGAGIVRAMSRVRGKREADEMRRIHEEHMEPIREDEHVEWDGLRRRKTSSTAHTMSVKRTKTVHPPLGMSHFPNDDDNVSEPDSEVHPGFFGRIGRKSRSGTVDSQTNRSRKGHSPVPLRDVDPETVEGGGVHTYGLPPGLQPSHDGASDTEYKGASSTHIHFAGGLPDPRDRAPSHSSSLAPPRPPPHASGTGGGTRRQFSFQNVFHRKRSDAASDGRPTSRGALSFISRHSPGNTPDNSYPGTSGNGATEEERLGLVHGDSSNPLPKYAEVVSEEPREEERDSDEWQVTSGTSSIPHDVEVDLGRQRRNRDPHDDYYDDDDDDELYDEPLSPPVAPRQGGGGRGGGGSPGAFV